MMNSSSHLLVSRRCRESCTTAAKLLGYELPHLVCKLCFHQVEACSCSSALQLRMVCRVRLLLTHALYMYADVHACHAVSSIYCRLYSCSSVGHHCDCVSCFCHPGHHTAGSGGAHNVCPGECTSTVKWGLLSWPQHACLAQCK